jgi:hypothetical protein
MFCPEINTARDGRRVREGVAQGRRRVTRGGAVGLPSWRVPVEGAADGGGPGERDRQRSDSAAAPMPAALQSNAEDCSTTTGCGLGGAVEPPETTSVGTAPGPGERGRAACHCRRASEAERSAEPRSENRSQVRRAQASERWHRRQTVSPRTRALSPGKERLHTVTSLPAEPGFAGAFAHQTDRQVAGSSHRRRLVRRVRTSSTVGVAAILAAIARARSRYATSPSTSSMPLVIAGAGVVLTERAPPALI